MEKQLQAMSDRHKEEMEKQLQANERHKEEVEEQLQAMNDRHKEEEGIRFAAFKANLLDAFIVELANRHDILMPAGTNNENADRTQRMATASAIVNKITEQNWKDKTKLPVAYRKDLEEYTNHALKRRKWAHESENAFAKLLLTPYFQENSQFFNVDHWAKLLLWVYRKHTLEEMAAEAPGIPGVYSTGTVS